MSGRDIEIDKQLTDEIRDMLIHLLRNAVDHGIEAEEVRIAAGKEPTGNLSLKAETVQDRVVITVADDGRGLDVAAIRDRVLERGLADAKSLQKMSNSEVYRFIFQQGFSTASAVTDISGRGVGMDVVATIMKKYNSSVAVESVSGKGTKFILSLPVNASILSVTLFESRDEIYAISSMQIQSIVRSEVDDLRFIDGRPMMVYSGQVIPVFDAAVLMGYRSKDEPLPGITIVVHVADGMAGIAVDRIVFEKKMVLKQVSGMRASFPQISGMVALASRSVIVINPRGLIEKGTGGKATVPVLQ